MLKFFSSLGLRQKMFIGSLVVGSVLSISVYFVVRQYQTEFEDYVMPELIALGRLEVDAMDLVAEFNELIIESDEESRKEVQRLEDSLKEHLAQFAATAAQNKAESESVILLRKAIDEIIMVGDMAIATKAEIDREFREIEDIENELESLLSVAAARSHDELYDAISQGDWNHLAQTAIPKKEAIYQVLAISTEILSEHREYLISAEDETIKEIEELKEEISEEFEKYTQVITTSEEVEEASEIDALVAKIQTEFDKLLEESDELNELRQDLEAKTEDLSTAIGAAVESTSSEGIALVSTQAVASIGISLLIPLATAAMIWWLASLVLSPIDKLKDVAGEYGEGRFDNRVSVSSEDELGELATAFNSMAADMENLVERQKQGERLSTLGQISGTISHELRNPLGTIRTSVFNLKEKLKGQDLGIEKTVDRIERNVVRCDDIVSSLLDFVRQRNAMLERHALDGWLKQILDETAVPDRITLETDLHSDAMVELDRVFLSSAFINIFQNGCQAMIDSDPAVLRVSTAVRDDRVEICIQDTGPGIPEESQEKIFEALYSTKTYGIGLGLPTVRQAMEIQKGGVEVSSEIGVGTTFILWLPLVKLLEQAP